jgi:hypothetical protein
MMIPAKFSKMIIVKNFRYVLNQRSKRIHRLIFDFDGADFFTVALSSLASVAFHPAGHDSDSSGTLENGDIPSWTGEVGDIRVSSCIPLS